MSNSQQQTTGTQRRRDRAITENMIGHGVDKRGMRIQMFLNLGLDLIQLRPEGFPHFFHRVQGFNDRIGRHGRDIMEYPEDCQGQLSV